MTNMRFILVVIFCVAAAGASAQPFEQQLSQFSQNTTLMARQNRQIFLNAQAAAAQSQAAWHKVTGPDGSFTAEMPSAPEYTTTTMNGNRTGTSSTLHQYVSSKGTSDFFLHTKVLPANTTYNQQGGLDGIAKAVGFAKWISVTWTKHQGLPAVEAIALKDGMELRVFLVSRGDQYFSCTYVGPNGTARSEDANRFISSLYIR